MLEGALRERIRTNIRRVCKELGVQIVSGVLSREHVHTFVEIQPHIASSDFVRRFKGRSSRGFARAVGGRTKLEPTKEQRNDVRALASCGTAQEVIARYLPMDWKGTIAAIATKRIVLFVTFIVSGQIDETKPSHANVVVRSEHEKS